MTRRLAAAKARRIADFVGRSRANGPRFSRVHEAYKPELESRLGLSELSLGGTAYVGKQTTANLNLATQDTAETFGCKDVVVKYSVGSHNGQFGVFMEKAKGCEGSGFACMDGVGGDDGIAPQNLGDEIKDDEERRKIKGTVAQKLNNLMWLDLITGQGDRHWNNYFVHIHKDTHEVTVKGIDNAKKLFRDKKVYGTEQWQDKTNLFTMTNIVSNVEIEKSDGTTITADPNLKHVRDLCTRECPSLYKRENFQDMFTTFVEL